MQAPARQFYTAIDGGVFQGHFNSHYLDKTDIIPQNISNTALQDGYTAGLAIGYLGMVTNRAFLGVELSIHADSHSAIFQSGAATTAFSDDITLRHHVDFMAIPGLKLQETLLSYLKIGVSRASLRDELTSPVGFNPVMTHYPTSQTHYGFAAALGIRHTDVV